MATGFPILPLKKKKNQLLPIFISFISFLIFLLRGVCICILFFLSSVVKHMFLEMPWRGYELLSFILDCPRVRKARHSEHYFVISFPNDLAYLTDSRAFISEAFQNILVSLLSSGNPELNYARSRRIYFFFFLFSVL